MKKMRSIDKINQQGFLLLIVFTLIISTMIASAFAFLVSRHNIVNEFSAGENSSHIEEEFGDYAGFTASESYTKEVAVKNDGSVECYVRMFAEIESPDVAEKLTVNYNNDGWTEKQEDGYYYYKNRLKPGEKTAPLFTEITANHDTDEFQMICYSETVQAGGAENPVDAFYF